MKIAAVQMDIAWHDRQANHATARRFCEQAADAGAELVLLPELFATGFAMDPARTAEPEDGPTPTFLAETAARLGITLVGGYVRRATAAEGPTGKGYTDKGWNTALTVGPDGRTLARYDKTHLIRLLGEDRAHLAGPEPVAFPVGDLQATCFVCYDLRFPELFRLMADRCGLMMVMASWPDARQEHWDLLLRARAVENQCFVMGCNRVGQGGGLDFAGGSVIIDPVGGVLDSLQNEEGLVLAEIDPGQVRQVRTDLPFLADRRF